MSTTTTTATTTTTLTRPSIPVRSKSDYGASAILPNPLPSPDEDPAFTPPRTRAHPPALPTSPTLDLLSFPLPPRPVSFLRSNSNISATSPAPISAFSDYGSTPACSTVEHTPWDELEPAAADSPHGSAHTAHGRAAPADYFSIPGTRADDYEGFAAAIQRKHYEFVLPSFPPKRLVEKRPNFARAAAEGGAEDQVREGGVQPAGEDEDERYASTPMSFGTTAGGGAGDAPITPPTDGDEAGFSGFRRGDAVAAGQDEKV